MWAKKLVWHEIIEEIGRKWEFITMMHEKKVVIKQFEYSILSAKEDRVKNSQISQKFIKFVNERSLSELRSIDVVDRVGAIMEITKMIRKEEDRVKDEECLGVGARNI